jgi:hypothetical protein
MFPSRTCGMRPDTERRKTMEQIPDAPWIRDPEYYQERYRYKPDWDEDEEDDDEEETEMET